LINIKDLRKTLIQNKASWTANERILDIDEIPKFGLGGSEEGLLPSKDAAKLDFKALFAEVPGNPFLRSRQIAMNLSPERAGEREISVGTPHAMEFEAGPIGGISSSVDWRNRWGWPWITSIRDQNGCNACWAFAATALVESMVRIEHAVWCARSEGDVHKGMGAKCADLGNSAAALNWITSHGIADPDCFPWTTANIAYAPTADRNGRTVKIPSFTAIGSLQDQKAWLDGVGPIVTFFNVWTDFWAYGTGVYHKQATIGGKPNKKEGGHYMLVVGYDDANSCWIVKNSWNTGWGEGGYCRIGYGECDIDTYAKMGLKGTNPDPWTKRRMHGGNMIESGNGALHRNFEMLATANGTQIRHWWRDNSAAGFPWHQGVIFGNDAACCPTLTATTFNRNFESVHLTTNKRLHHWYFDQAQGKWLDGGVFGPLDAAGVPGFIQGNYNAPGNFEVVVRTADQKLNHWWRDGGGWHNGVRFGSNVSHSGPTLLQSHYGAKGNFELVCVLANGQMQHWWRDNDHGMVWNASALFGSGVSSAPCMIEGQYGAGNEKSYGNFELCVAVGGKVQHWWRANYSDMKWRNSATFGHDVSSVVSLVEGSYGFNLELIVLRTDKKLQHYWRDGAGWHEGPIIGAA
jgi:hypothetical protein